MRDIFRRTFNPTPDEELEYLQKYRSIFEKSYIEKWCSSCVNYIPVPDNLPGVVSASPDCKLGGLAIKTCLLYDCNAEARKRDEKFFADWEKRIQERRDKTM